MKQLIKPLALSALTAFAATAAQAEIKWNMPTPYADGTHHTQNVRQFADDVATATDGEMEIIVHSGASLVKHPEIHRAVRSGQVPIGEVFMGLLGNENPLYQADNIPFLVTSFDGAKALWDATRPEVEAAMAEQGLQLLYAVPWPPQGFYSKEEITSGADFEGMRMRAYSATTSRMSELLGATPTTVQTPEIPQAFSTGIIEAMATSPTTGVSSQAWDYTDYYLDARAWIPKNMVFVNARAFSRLPSEVQEAVLEAAAAAETRGWEMAIAETDAKTAELADNGITVYTPNADLTETLGNVGQTMTNEWFEEMGYDSDNPIADIVGQ
ncbi:C4-dicarboxylate ABC transporter substrate-binding protein [Saccharospirillum sp. MSK14-1]|uniref:TRAP transporter substrate-binding protein n=1 Tax=Saccharospirillum sp. MSK14-1 TaxID=1897632 RepID=UPI000D399059|nr:TRAP transporter substrate-binding protein [Saccharospirillum sp. MSK14-1]PTY38007.1 C4-dicarboxylate ABC transporter substrate-binding protein [Saccharospirillum sp. MSK14-1]